MRADVVNFIEHYGVKGQKWGVRKREDPSRSASNWKARKDKERAEKEAKTGKGSSEKKKDETTKSKPASSGKTTPTKAPKALSDDELRAAVQRLQLEKQYNDLMREPTTAKKQTKGQKFAKGLGEVGINVVKKSVTEVGTEVLKKELKKKLKV